MTGLLIPKPLGRKLRAPAGEGDAVVHGREHLREKGYENTRLGCRARIVVFGWVPTVFDSIGGLGDKTEVSFSLAPTGSGITGRPSQ